MKKLIAILLLSLASSLFALPDCPSDLSVRWHNCLGTYNFDGDIFVGEFKDSKRNGQGIYSYANGDKFFGEYKDDKIHGQGTFTYAFSGDKYVGEYKDSKRNGLGTYTFGKNSEFAGDKYVGEYKDEEYHGQGTYIWANGDKYAGEFKDGERSGLGTYTYATGKRDVGYYLKDKYVPDICEGMGLSKGSSGFEQCVLRLIDKI